MADRCSLRPQKIGACRHGDRCSRKHVKPSYSQTILMPNLYQNPSFDPKNRMNASQLQNHFDAFYEDIWCELCKYGELEELVVCDNNNDRTFRPCPAPPCLPFRADILPLKISSAMSTPASSTRNRPSKPATPSTAAGMPAVPSTASSAPSPTSARPVAGSIRARAASAAASATLSIAGTPTKNWREI